ncbi:PAS domain-containing sensor histidine kinase [Laceyella sacchari]|uniref:Sensor histidine kinase n=1 Tax=Laceyella sacchari TaxID=37482 RepID=A0ABY5U275_LACSH|nr:PAS domain-containing sensor histidine kinase [Laceyella sacchari]TCW41736.1 two-component system sensor histidine kinase NreB [Laceyella sacchari]UWE02357.1 PAS domain-containing sensor histidine kinase [Laceyella sacchari]
MMSYLSGESDLDVPSYYEAIFQHAADAIFVVQPGGVIREANRAALTLTGYSRSELNNILFCSICKGIATCVEEASCTGCFFNHQSLSSFEMQIRAKDGRQYPVTASAATLPEDPLGSMVIVIRDMSQLQRTERERHHRLVTNKIIQAQEEERKRVSRELHDGVGQALYSILIGLKVINHLPLDDEKKRHLLDVQAMVEQTLDEVKNLATDLRPSALDDLGFLPAIRSYAKKFEATFDIKVELVVKGPKRRYSSTVETALYRIVQEAMINAAKYAATDKIKLSLIDTAAEVRLFIEDFGKGFDPSQVEGEGTGLGLYGMKERAALLGGALRIESAPNEGTMVYVRIPIDREGESVHADEGTHRG